MVGKAKQTRKFVRALGLVVLMAGLVSLVLPAGADDIFGCVGHGCELPCDPNCPPNEPPVINCQGVPYGSGVTPDTGFTRRSIAFGAHGACSWWAIDSITAYLLLGSERKGTCNERYNARVIAGTTPNCVRHGLDNVDLPAGVYTIESVIEYHFQNESYEARDSTQIDVL